MSAKITALDEQVAGTLHDDDLFVDVDVSDTTMAASGTDKKSKWSSIKSTLKSYFDTLYTNAKILQVLQAFKSDTATVTGTTFTAVTGLSQAITPSSASNTVMVEVVFYAGAATSNFPLIRITRGGTPIALGDAAGSRIQTGGGGNPGNQSAMQCLSIKFMDSPATTSATTYAVELASSSSGSVFCNRTNTDTDSTSYQRASSSITVSEIAA